jgi:hypothetical protein
LSLDFFSFFNENFSPSYRKLLYFFHEKVYNINIREFSARIGTLKTLFIFYEIEFKPKARLSLSIAFDMFLNC